MLLRHLFSYALALVLAINPTAPLLNQAVAAVHGVAPTVAVNRILVVMYGQSNMASMSDPTIANSAPVPVAVANTSFYNGTAVVAVPAANGVRNLLNSITTATGLPSIALNGSVGGSTTSGLVKGSAGYTNLFLQINAVIQPTDQVVTVWDQGEGNADAAPHPVENPYKATIAQLHSDMCTDMGRTLAACPFIMSSLGTTSAGVDGTIDSGTTDGSWSTIQNAIYNSSLEQPFNLFSHTNITLQRTDIYHYDGQSQGKQGIWFAQTIKKYLGLSSGDAYWKIAGATIVDATNTTVDFTHSLGTDFTPTSGGNGWEVSGDNGATWFPATSARNSSTQAQLTTIVSLSTTSARSVRYGWGMLPPNASGINPPSAPLFDNSSIQAPLTFTTWDVKPTPLSVVPVPTWRYGVTLTGTGQVQTAVGLPLGPPPSGGQRFLIFTSTGIAGVNGAVTVTPDIGSAVVASTPVKRQGNVQIHQILLGTDANAATKVDFSIDYGSNPFGGGLVQIYTVPLSDLSSTTNTGVGGASITANTAVTATVNVSAGGFIIQVTKANAQYSTGAVLTGTESYAKRIENGSPFHTYLADASNAAANAASSATGTFPITENIDMALVSWR